MKAGIIGCGNMGTEIALFIDRETDIDLKFLCDVDDAQVAGLLKKLGNGQIKCSMEELIENSDLVVESASKQAVREILKSENADKKGKKLLIMSTGGITDNMDLFCKIKNCGVYVPSGAIAGMDAIKAVAGEIKSLTLTTTKPVKGLRSSPYIIKSNIGINNLKNKKTIFEGNLEEAIDGFPQNINVAATLFLASRFENIKIKIIADPDAEVNMHEIICEGDFGKMKLKTENLPSKNPKTSWLAVLSAIQTLRDIKGNVRIGN
ncbi:DUF108 domain-containing protein [Candidatus Woesearchaeota archaeon]|nr:DUF108 domain-containing protein [Candidatus Woesearchaeota archaeon]